MNAFEYQQIVEPLAEGGINDQIHGIPVRVRFDGERYFISDEVVDLYGVGNTIEDALEDYWLAAQETFADLTAHADKLAPHLQHQLAFLPDYSPRLKPGGSTAATALSGSRNTSEMTGATTSRALPLVG